MLMNVIALLDNYKKNLSGFDLICLIFWVKYKQHV